MIEINRSKKYGCCIVCGDSEDSYDININNGVSSVCITLCKEHMMDMYLKIQEVLNITHKLTVNVVLADDISDIDRIAKKIQFMWNKQLGNTHTFKFLGYSDSEYQEYLDSMDTLLAEMLVDTKEKGLQNFLIVVESPKDFKHVTAFVKDFDAELIKYEITRDGELIRY